MNPELNAKILVWRQKSLAGTLTQDEMREAVREMRAGRITAAQHSAKAKAPKKAPIDSDDLLKELM